MQMTMTDEQNEFRQGLRRFLGDKSSSAEVRKTMTTDVGYDPAVWALMGKQLGLQGLIVPEEFGGGGFGQVELMVVFEEMGRALLCAPYFSTVALATNALLLSGDDVVMQAILPGIAAGDTIATLAAAEESGRLDFSRMECRADRDTYGAWHIHGDKSFVLDGHIADVYLVAAHAPDGPSLFVVEGDAAGLDRRSVETIDTTRRMADVSMRGAPARLVGAEGDGSFILSRTLDLAMVALAAEQVGGAQRCLEMSVEYAKLRMQFGRPIGSFQAIKHRCVDMLLEVESARSAATFAAGAIADRSEDTPHLAALARAYCSDAYFHAAAQNIQIHGGIGFTWEHDAHLHYRRAKSSELLYGGSSEHYERVAAGLFGALT